MNPLQEELKVLAKEMVKANKEYTTKMAKIYERLIELSKEDSNRYTEQLE